MEIKRVDDRPMVVHTKEKPKIHVKEAPETKIKGMDVLAVQRGPKTAGSVAGESGAADGRTKRREGSAHVQDKRKTGQTGAAADNMEPGGRNGSVPDRNVQGRNVQGRNTGGNRQDGNAQTGDGAVKLGDTGGNVRAQSGNAPIRDGAVQFRETGGSMRAQTGNAPTGSSAAHSGGADRTMQAGQGNGQEIRQPAGHGSRIHAKQAGLAGYRRAKAGRVSVIQKKPSAYTAGASVSADGSCQGVNGHPAGPVSAAVASAAKAALDEMEGGQEVHDAYMAAATLAKPAADAVDAGRRICHSKAAGERGPKIRKTQPGSRIRGKTANGKAARTAGETAKIRLRKTVKVAGRGEKYIPVPGRGRRGGEIFLPLIFPAGRAGLYEEPGIMDLTV